MFTLTSKLLPYLGFQFETEIEELLTAGGVIGNEGEHIRRPMSSSCILFFFFLKHLKQRLPEIVGKLRNICLLSANKKSFKQRTTALEYLE